MAVAWKKGLLLAQSALCVVLVVMLSVGVIGIYRQGIAEKQENSLAWIYTREKLGTALKPVAPVFLLSAATTIACAVLHVRDENEDKPVRDIELTRNLMRRRVAEPDDDMKRERKWQMKLLYLGWAGFALCMLPVLLYMADGSHFQNGDLEEMVASLWAHVIPWTAAGLACLAVSTVLQGGSIQRECDAITAHIKEETAAGIRPQPAEKAAAPELRRRWARFVLLALAVVFIIAGIFNGSMTAVVNKAIRICTECVGLG